MENHLDLPQFEDKGFTWNVEIGRQNETGLFNSSNTKHFQHWDHYEPALPYANKHFKTFTMSMIKQLPGQLIPNHHDGYHHFRDNHPGTHLDDVVRHMVFLEDWKPGHYFELEFKPIIEWKAGDMIVLNHQRVHCSANVGKDPKYTLQITGILK